MAQWGQRAKQVPRVHRAHPEKWELRVLLDLLAPWDGLEKQDPQVRKVRWEHKVLSEIPDWKVPLVLPVRQVP